MWEEVLKLTPLGVSLRTSTVRRANLSHTAECPYGHSAWIAYAAFGGTAGNMRRISNAHVLTDRKEYDRNMAVNEKEVEQIVKQILGQLSGNSVSAQTAAPAQSRTGAGIPAVAHVAMLTELEKFEVKEFPMPQVGDDDILVKEIGRASCRERV